MNQPRLQGRRHGIRRWSAAPVLALLAGAAIGHAGVNAQEATFYSGPVAPLTAAVWNELARAQEVRLRSMLASMDAFPFKKVISRLRRSSFEYS